MPPRRKPVKKGSEQNLVPANISKEEMKKLQEGTRQRFESLRRTLPHRGGLRIDPHQEFGDEIGGLRKRIEKLEQMLKLASRIRSQRLKQLSEKIRELVALENDRTQNRRREEDGSSSPIDYATVALNDAIRLAELIQKIREVLQLLVETLQEPVF